MSVLQMQTVTNDLLSFDTDKKDRGLFAAYYIRFNLSKRTVEIIRAMNYIELEVFACGICHSGLPQGISQCKNATQV